MVKFKIKYVNYFSRCKISSRETGKSNVPANSVPTNSIDARCKLNRMTTATDPLVITVWLTCGLIVGFTVPYALACRLDVLSAVTAAATVISVFAHGLGAFDGVILAIIHMSLLTVLALINLLKRMLSQEPDEEPLFKRFEDQENENETFHV